MLFQSAQLRRSSVLNGPFCSHRKIGGKTAVQQSPSRQTHSRQCPTMQNMALHEKQKVGEEQPKPTAAHHTITTPLKLHPLICTGAEPINLVHGRLELLIMEASQRNGVMFLPLSRVFLYICVLCTHTNTYLLRLSPSGFFGPSECLVPTSGLTLCSVCVCVHIHTYTQVHSHPRQK